MDQVIISGEAGLAREKIGKAIGIGGFATMDRAERVVDNGIPELVETVDQAKTLMETRAAPSAASEEARSPTSETFGAQSLQGSYSVASDLGEGKATAAIGLDHRTWKVRRGSSHGRSHTAVVGGTPRFLQEGRG